MISGRLGLVAIVLVAVVAATACGGGGSGGQDAQGIAFEADAGWDDLDAAALDAETLGDAGIEQRDAATIIPQKCRFVASEVRTPVGRSSPRGRGVNASGTVVLEAEEPGTGALMTFISYPDGTVRELGLPPGARQRSAVAISPGGKVIGSVDSPRVYGKRRGYLWSEGRDDELPPLPGDSSSEATAINDYGVVVGFSEGPGLRAVSWSNGHATALPSLRTGKMSQAYGINDQGVIVGCAYPTPDLEPGHHAVLWRDGTIEDLAPDTCARAINSRGQVLLWGALREPDGTLPVFKPFCEGGLVEPEGLSDQGHVLGYSLCWEPENISHVRHLTLWWKAVEPVELEALIDWGDVEPLAHPYGPVIGRDARILLSGGDGRIVMLTLNEGCGR